MVTAILAHPDHIHLVTVGMDQRIKTWDLQKKTNLQTIRSKKGLVLLYFLSSHAKRKFCADIDYVLDQRL